MGHWIEDGMAAREGVTYPIRSIDLPRLRRVLLRVMEDFPYHMKDYDGFRGSPEAEGFFALVAEHDAELLALWHDMRRRMDPEYVAHGESYQPPETDAPPCEMGAVTAYHFHEAIKSLLDRIRYDATTYCFSRTAEYVVLEEAIDGYADAIAERFEPEWSDFSRLDTAMREGRVLYATVNKQPELMRRRMSASIWLDPDTYGQDPIWAATGEGNWEPLDKVDRAVVYGCANLTGWPHGQRRSEDLPRYVRVDVRGEDRCWFGHTHVLIPKDKWEKMWEVLGLEN